MYERILVAVDGSPVSDRALGEAVKLAQLTGGELRVITIVDSPLRHLPDYAVYYNPEPLREAALKAADDVLAKAREQVGDKVKAKFDRVCQERASEEIAERIELEAEDAKADVIVMGTHGRRGVRRLMLGSVAEGLLRVSNRPVLLVRDN
ncbi:MULTISPECIES: universal stress protein [Pseudomonas]|uniref:universal stress protein n=1 Tax=Pseudomonas TaxID=286 RepID=UPI00209E9B22|nr:universal stress protein [Pseudomonas citronellolis]MCP1642348.1 nucleotide-binding universal stress UspA family protein [Pseudomonas citronellolis]MCP1665541.1 nucleotide-binding universal stress UspA family protein [Pseudomonas citronellolis]MCP1696181.1 nucleotide-binding universal stress UspA family protein [Pseudomonas citronellolis]MCP1703078.1 nucleotide-binding universal stress UspA family protein [Pseudomonas citronellolis]MCP1796961.1 nucleotide-binding universal stress UspA famil